MKIFGYRQEDEEYTKLLTMREICFDLNPDEIDDLIEFFKFARERHRAVADSAHEIHTHYDEWKNGKLTPKRCDPDIIISTIFEKNPPVYINLKDETN